MSPFDRIGSRSLLYTHTNHGRSRGLGWEWAWPGRCHALDGRGHQLAVVLVHARLDRVVNGSPGILGQRIDIRRDAERLQLRDVRVEVLVRMGVRMCMRISARMMHRVGMMMWRRWRHWRSC